MKTIILHTPALTNRGIRIDAGGIVKIGDGDDQIAASRAAEMVALGLAAPPPSEPAAAPPQDVKDVK